ncbi:hypothetical protein PULV_a3921 [Pseudoalteromonas ulvae UL12]|nr:hypothetical protein [Pseudoalteromonas ulvae UL12]
MKKSLYCKSTTSKSRDGLVKIDINDKKITDFRELVNDNSSFVCKKYKNINNKNLWNPICSCMDWITVSIRFLQDSPELSENIDIRVMQMYSFISAIDIVTESITQLHRVFIDPKSIPFKSEKTIFLNKLVDVDDTNYFKEIRACFGAHPVNLNPKDKGKRFASWPFDGMNSGSSDLDVLLYSNIPNEEDLTLSLNSNELIAFLKSRYEYLDVISEEIKRQFISFKEKHSQITINTFGSPLEKLKTLAEESLIRFDNDYYESVINDLIIIFGTTLDGEEYQTEEVEFKESLLPLIEEIKTNLQSVEIKDLEYHSLIYINSSLDSELSYELPKFYSWLYRGEDDPLLNYYIKRLNKVSENKYKFNETDGCDKSFLKLKLMLRRFSSELTGR